MRSTRWAKTSTSTGPEEVAMCLPPLIKHESLTLIGNATGAALVFIPTAWEQSNPQPPSLIVDISAALAYMVRDK